MLRAHLNEFFLSFKGTLCPESYMTPTISGRWVWSLYGLPVFGVAVQSSVGVFTPILLV